MFQPHHIRQIILHRWRHHFHGRHAKTAVHRSSRLTVACRLNLMPPTENGGLGDINDGILFQTRLTGKTPPIFNLFFIKTFQRTRRRFGRVLFKSDTAFAAGAVAAARRVNHHARPCRHFNKRKAFAYVNAATTGLKNNVHWFVFQSVSNACYKDVERRHSVRFFHERTFYNMSVAKSLSLSLSKSKAKSNSIAIEIGTATLQRIGCKMFS
jgi:hypothetical protein